LATSAPSRIPTSLYLPPSRVYIGWSDWQGGFANLASPFEPQSSRNRLARLAAWHPTSWLPWLRGDDARPMVRLGDLFSPDVPRWFVETALRALYRRGDVDWQLVTQHAGRAAEVLAGYPGPRHIWLGSRIETQRDADENVAVLAGIEGFPVRFLACAPLREPVRLGLVASPGIVWVAIGGTYGHRPRGIVMERQWAIEAVQEARQAGAAVLWYGAGGKRPDLDPKLAGKRWQEWPKEE
jgi:protein gp37